MSDRRSLLKGLAASPMALTGLALAPALQSSAADPFPGYHREVVDLIAAIDNGDGDEEAIDLLMDRWAEIDRLAMSTRPTTLAGAAACLDHARREYIQFVIVDGSDPTNGLVVSLLDGALDVLRRATTPA